MHWDVYNRFSRYKIVIKEKFKLKFDARNKSLIETTIRQEKEKNILRIKWALTTATEDASMVFSICIQIGNIEKLWGPSLITITYQTIINCTILKWNPYSSCVKGIGNYCLFFFDRKLLIVYRLLKRIQYLFEC